MKRAFVTALFAVLFFSYSALALPAQEVEPTEPQLQSRPKAPNEQLLSASSVAPFMVPNPKKFPQKYAAVYMPVSLAAGRVRTPEFVAKYSQAYDIMLQFEKPLPFSRMECMAGVTGPSRLDKKDCQKDDPIVRADWTVWGDGRIVEWGSMRDCCDSIFGNKYIFKLVGMFPLEAGKKYVVQVHFTKDGSALNVANPRLIVIAHGDMW